MNGFAKICLIISVVSGAIGFLAGHKAPILGGLTKALSGVFFILFYISFLLADEKMDSDMKAKRH